MAVARRSSMAGARAVFATDINPERLRDGAAKMGADLVLDARDDVVARLRARDRRQRRRHRARDVRRVSGASPGSRRR